MIVAHGSKPIADMSEPTKTNVLLGHTDGRILKTDLYNNKKRNRFLSAISFFILYFEDRFIVRYHHNVIDT